MALVIAEILTRLEEILKSFQSKFDGNINSPDFVGSEEETSYYNIWADFWRYVIGVNVVPMITRLKTAHEGLLWTKFQHLPISEEQHEIWKANKMFNQGMAIICGTVWHNPEKKGLQLNAIDADNLPAVNEICYYKGKQFTVQQFAKWTLVEQHEDAPDKMHIVVYSTKSFMKKASNNNSPALKAGIKSNEIPAIEVKSSDDSFLFVSGSPHKGGFPYKIIGTEEPAICDDFESHIDSICTKYKIPYLSADNGNGKAEIPIEELFEEGFDIYENDNRHEALMRVMESLIKRNRQILPLEYIKETLSRDWNNKHCKPPLDDYEFNKQWKCAIKFIEQKQQEEDERFQKFRFGTSTYTSAGTESTSPAGSLSQEEKYILEERIKIIVEAYHELNIISTPEAVIERFNIKTTRPDKEIFYFDKDKGIYLPYGNIVIEECLERSSKNADMFYTSIYEMVAKLYPDIEDTKLWDKTISERLTDEGVEPGQEWSNKEIKEFIGHVERQTYFYRDDFNSKIEWLACKDCMVNLLTGETANFSPEYLCTTQIPVKYYVPEPNVIGTNDLNRLSGCPRILKFLHDIVEPEDVETILDFFAYCLWRDYKYHNWMLFNGFGQNGKSTLLYLLGIFLGSHNVSAESLQRILKRDFSSAQLYGKLANIDADLSTEALTNTGLLKKLTGGDRLTAEYKYKPLFEFRSYTKLIFSANEIPMSADMTDAFYRRLIIINFVRQFFDDKDDPDLKFRITTEAELSGFLRLLIARLPSVLEKGIRATTNEAIKETRERYLLSANPMKYFVEKALNPITRNEKLTPKIEMYDGYLRFCRHYRLPVETDQSFSRKLTQEYGFHYEKHRIHKGQVGVLCWDDVKLSDWVGTNDESQLTFEELEETRAAGLESEKKLE